MFRSWSSFCAVASSASRGPRRSWTTSTWWRGPCLNGLTGRQNDLTYVIHVACHWENVSSLAKRWDPSEPGVAELLKQGVYLPLPGYDDQVKTEKSTFFLLQVHLIDWEKHCPVRVRSLLCHYWQYQIFISGAFRCPLLLWQDKPIKGNMHPVVLLK